MKQREEYNNTQKVKIMMNIIELNKDELTRRWSKSLVKKYAPQPYRTAKNYYGGANICYYLVADIERIEQMPEFQ